MTEAKRKSLAISHVFDIETESWDRFVVGGLRDCQTGQTDLYWWEDEEAYVDRLLAIEGTIAAHNGGRFDALWLLGHIAARKIPCTVALAGATVVTVRAGKLTIVDTARIVPMSLDKFARMFGARKADTDLPCVCPGEESCGGYCSITRDMAPYLRERLASYLVADLTILERSWHGLADYADRHDLDLRTTIGSSAWATALRRCDLLGPAVWSDAHGSGGARAYKLCREGYYGGRVTGARWGEVPAWHSYDRNSAYPAALRDLALPLEGRRQVDTGAALYNTGRDGIVRASVDVPLSYCPPLPIRVGARIAYPTGRFEGVWATNELRYAEQCGVRIERVGAGVFWDTSARVFPAFVSYLYSLRADAFKAHTRECKPDCDGKKHPLATWLKLYANSLTGKFGQDPSCDAIETATDISRLFCQAPQECFGDLCRGKRCCKHVCKGSCGKWEALGKGDLFHIRQIWQFAPSMHVQFAAHLTANARTELHKEMQDDLCYTDTDSVKRLDFGRTQNLGLELGKWNYEGEKHDCAVLALKTYVEHDAGGKREARSKGIRNADDNWDAIVAGDSIATTVGVEGLRTALRSGKTFVRKSLSRKVTPDPVWIGDRMKLPHGHTRAATYEETIARR